MQLLLETVLATQEAANCMPLPEAVQIQGTQGNMASHYRDFSLAKGTTELIELHVGSHQKRQYSQTPQKIALKFWVMLGFVGVCFVLFQIVQT